MSVNRADPSGLPGAELCRLSAPSSFAGRGVQEFTALGCRLRPETAYFLVVSRHNLHTATIRLKTAASAAEDLASMPGWTIGDQHHARLGGVWTAAGEPLQIEVRALPARNNPASGSARVLGRAWLGETLSADVSAIVDRDGLSSPDFSYQWLQWDELQLHTEILGATSPTYRVRRPDVGRLLGLQLDFVDDHGSSERLVAAMDSSVFDPGYIEPGARDDGASGLVLDYGSGREAVADTSGITDPNGLPSPVGYVYRWQRDIGEGWEEIDGVSGPRYRPPLWVETAEIRVVVNFLDAEGFPEQLVSDAITFGGSPGVLGALKCPVMAVACFVIELGTRTDTIGYSRGLSGRVHLGAISDPTFEIGGETYTVLEVGTYVAGVPFSELIGTSMTLDRPLPREVVASSVLGDLQLQSVSVGGFRPSGPSFSLAERLSLHEVERDNPGNHR